MFVWILFDYRETVSGPFGTTQYVGSGPPPVGSVEAISAAGTSTATKAIAITVAVVTVLVIGGALTGYFVLRGK